MTETEEKKSALRDRFAESALMGILSNEVCMRELLSRDDNPKAMAEMVAERAFIYADAMTKHSKLYA